MEPYLSDPKVQDALSDPRVKEIMQALKTDREKAERCACVCFPVVYKHGYVP